MIPFLLAAAGGYLIGSSLKSKQYADGGEFADGGQIDQNISSNVKLYYKYDFESDVAASNGEDGKSLRLSEKADKYRDEAIILINSYNKKNNTNFTFQDFNRDGSLREGISSGLKVPEEYNNPEAEKGRYKYVVEVKHPYQKESFITNFSPSEKDRDPSYQAALKVIKDAQKDEGFKQGHIMFSYYSKDFGRSYYTVYVTEKKADGGIMAHGGDIRKIKGNNFSQQIENGQRFKALIQKVFDDQKGDRIYPLEYIKATALTPHAIVKIDGKNYISGDAYKGTYSHFEFMDDPNFIKALEYVDRPKIRAKR